jgi:hypothetical protein
VEFEILLLIRSIKNPVTAFPTAWTNSGHSETSEVSAAVEGCLPYTKESCSRERNEGCAVATLLPVRSRLETVLDLK